MIEGMKVRQAMRDIDSKYETLCASERLFQDPRSCTAAGLLWFIQSGLAVPEEHSDKLHLDLIALCKEFSLSPEELHEVLGRHEAVLVTEPEDLE